MRINHDFDPAANSERGAGLTVTRVLVTDICAVACFMLATSEGRAWDDETAANRAAGLCLLLRDTLAAAGHAAPVVALVACADEPQFLALHRWAGNQEWHRGEFMLRPLWQGATGPRPYSELDRIADQLADAADARLQPIRLEPAAPDALAQRIDAELQATERSKDAQGATHRRDLLMALRTALREPAAFQAGACEDALSRAIEHWTTTIAARARSVAEQAEEAVDSAIAEAEPFSADFSAPA